MDIKLDMEKWSCHLDVSHTIPSIKLDMENKGTKVLRVADGDPAPGVHVEGQKISFDFNTAGISTMTMVQWIRQIYQHLDVTRPSEHNRYIIYILDMYIKNTHSLLHTARPEYDHLDRRNYPGQTCRERRLYPQQYYETKNKQDKAIRYHDGPLVLTYPNTSKVTIGDYDLHYTGNYPNDPECSKCFSVKDQTLTIDFEHCYPDDVLALIRDMFVANSSD